jgi:hypothetical protein
MRKAAALNEALLWIVSVEEAIQRSKEADLVFRKRVRRGPGRGRGFARALDPVLS